MNTNVDPTVLKQRLDFAVDAARQASDYILKYYQASDLAVELKSDQSPVTVADRGAEELLRELILAAFPDDGVLGEEFPETPGRNGFRWILDPIDGTKSFVHGVPLFGTLIGLEFEKESLLGVCRFPALDEVVYAAKGQGAWWQCRDEAPRPAKVSKATRLEDAVFCTTTMTRWETIGHRDTFDTLCRTARLTRGWGDCFGHMLVATGRIDVMVDPAMSPWDACALLPIVEEAGGVWMDWKGESTIYSGNGISVTPGLKERILELVKR